MKHALLSIALGTLMGCAAMLPAPTDEIAKLPVVRVGDQAPQSNEYVVFYPAGFPFPAKFKASGSLFASEKHIETQLTLAKDLYLYKYWASHDGKTWTNSHKLLDVDFGGGFDVNGLQTNVKLEAN